MTLSVGRLTVTINWNSPRCRERARYTRIEHEAIRIANLPVRNQYGRSPRVEAVKYLRNELGLPLKEAKNLLDQIAPYDYNITRDD